MHAVIKRTAVLIEQAKRASARSYLARFKAMSIAGWALLLRRDAASLAPSAGCRRKKRQVKGG